MPTPTGRQPMTRPTDAEVRKMTPYVDRDPNGDITIRDAVTGEAICYMPSCGPASRLPASKRWHIESIARRIVVALTAQETTDD